MTNKDHVTIMAGVFSSGLILPPLFIYGGTRHVVDMMRNAPGDWLMEFTENGWMDRKLRSSRSGSKCS